MTTMLSREVAKKLVKGNWYADISIINSNLVSFLKFSHSDQQSLYFTEQYGNSDNNYGVGSGGFIVFYHSTFYEPTAQDNKNNYDILSLQQRYNNLLEEFEQYKLESIKWSVDDFMEYPGCRLTREQAQEALEKMIARHDADRGITWSDVEYYLNEFSEIKILD